MLINWARAACHRQHLCFNFGLFFFCFVRRKFNYYYCNIINFFCLVHSHHGLLFVVFAAVYLLFFLSPALFICSITTNLPLSVFFPPWRVRGPSISPLLTCTTKLFLFSLFLLSMKITSWLLIVIPNVANNRNIELLHNHNNSTNHLYGLIKTLKLLRIGFNCKETAKMPTVRISMEIEQKKQPVDTLRLLYKNIS